MDVLVAVTDAARLADDFEIREDDVPGEYLEYDINEWDEYALEEAVSAREAGHVEEVTTVTVGPPRLEETIRTALAKGADRAIRVWDEALAERRLLDVGTKTTLLASLIERESPDLVLTGVQASDAGFGATGVSTAAAAEYAWAAVVNDLDLDPAGEVAHVHRELEGGVEELCEVDLPAVLTIQTGINDPRYASLRGIRQAQQTEITEYSLSDLGVSPSEIDQRLRLTGMQAPEAESDAEFIEGGPDEQAARLATVLAELGVSDA